MPKTLSIKIIISVLSLFGFSQLALAQTTVLKNAMDSGNMLCFQDNPPGASYPSVSNGYNLSPGGEMWLSSPSQQAQFAIQLNAPAANCQAPANGYGQGSLGIGNDAKGNGFDYTNPPVANGVTIVASANPAADCGTGADVCYLVQYSGGSNPPAPPVNPVDPTAKYPNAQTYSTGIQYRGVNLSGAEFADDGTGKAPQGDFTPTLQDAALFLYSGMNTYRVPVTWEYLADMNGDFLTTDAGKKYLQHLDALITGTTVNSTKIPGLDSKNATVIIDVHNYMRYNPSNIKLNYQDNNPNGPDVIGSGSNAPTQEAYANLWTNIVARYNGPNVVYDLMNEPHDMPMKQVLALENAAIAAIRAEEQAKGVAPHLILIEGNYWTGLHSWNGNDLTTTDTINSEAYPQGIVDPANNFAIEVHQYFDNNASGTYEAPIGPVNDCITLDQFQKGYTYTDPNTNQPVTMTGFDTYWPEFTQWATQNKVRVFFGEFGSPDTPNCRADINYMLNAAQTFAYNPETNAGVIGWTVWAAGHAWGNYVNSIAPGGPANTLMWDNALYQNFLTPPAGSTMPTADTFPQIMELTNNTASTTLSFSSGNWPFFVKGSATLAPGQSAYLYSPSSSTTPVGKYILTYHVGNDTANAIGAFVENKTGQPDAGVSYSFNSTIPSLNIDNATGSSCTLPAGMTGQCWQIQDAAAAAKAAKAKQ